MTPSEYNSLMSSPYADEYLAGPDRREAIVVFGAPRRIASPGSLPVVVVVVCAHDDPGPPEADVVVTPDEVPLVLQRIAAAPLASATLAVLLRGVEKMSVDAGLAAESAAYSVLQAGPEFAAWRSSARHKAAADSGDVVATERIDDQLIVTLDRPHRHNAINARLRDELSAALSLAWLDDSIRRVIMRGNGQSFCSGGDLGEFGQRPDPATAHVTRLARSPARLIHRLRDRITVEVHGATMGGGLEMAAFASRVVAAPGTRFALPEIGLGLIPGAGGTVSVTARIGRRRTAELALTGREIDTETALSWGLVDAVAQT
jgi:1,4-dihydroxy-2-naphthoyl-CoA synthase